MVNMINSDANQEDVDYHVGKIPRMCSCGLSLLQTAYKAHLKDNTHNARFGTKGVIT